MRVVEPSALEDIIYVPDFCEGLVTTERWDNVQGVRQVRRDLLGKARQSKNVADGKQIIAPAPGLTLKYLLSGLLFCECGLRMTASSGGTYVTRDGERRLYVSYVCPGYLGGQCENGTRVPEEWVRSVVIAKLRERLFAGRESA